MQYNMMLGFWLIKQINKIELNWAWSLVLRERLLLHCKNEKSELDLIEVVNFGKKINAMHVYGGLGVEFWWLK